MVEAKILTNSSTSILPAKTKTTPKIFAKYRPDIMRASKKFLSNHDVAVYDMLRYSMGWKGLYEIKTSATKGKALRPTLCLLACAATGGSTKQAIPLAVAIEFIHNFSLIHDDIQDCDKTRHHRPTLWTLTGVPKAISAGNILRTTADSSLHNLTNAGIETEKVLEAISVLTKACLEMIEGQYLDVSYEGTPNISIDDYLNMIAKKTGALIRSSLHLGALIGTSNRSTINAFLSCGQSLGYLFQITDDILGIWGNENATGKPVGSDLKRKKKSLPVVHLMTQASEKNKNILIETYRKPHLSDKDINNIIDLMNCTKTKEYAQALAKTHCDKALESLGGIELTSEARNDLEELIGFLFYRDH